MSAKKSVIRQKLIQLVTELSEEYDVEFLDYVDIEDQVAELAITLEDIIENPDDIEELDFEKDNTFMDPDSDEITDGFSGYLTDSDSNEDD